MPETNPKHYTRLTPEPIEVIEAWNLNYHLGNALKYIARAGFKDNKMTDLKKAIWYIQREIDQTAEESTVISDISNGKVTQTEEGIIIIEEEPKQ